jgi:NADPH2:quinone reductase
MKSLGIVFPEANRVELQTFDLPEPGLGEVVLEASFSTLSPGTERNLMMGKFKPFPINIGYSFAGRVKQLGPGVTGLKVGQPVVTTGRHASYILADERFVTPVPEGVSLESAAFFNLAHTALYGIRRAEIQLGEPVAVIGQGLVGLITAKLAQLSGATPVIAVDIDEQRLDLSRRYGIPVVVNGADKPALAAILAELPGGGVAAAIEVTGALEPIAQALDMVRQRGRVVLLSSPNHDQPIQVYRQLSLKGASLIGAYINSKPWSLAQTQVEMPSWPPSLAPGSTRYVGAQAWTSDDDVRVFLDLLRYGALDLQPLITHRFTPHQAAEAYEMVLQQDRGLLGGVICWG